MLKTSSDNSLLRPIVKMKSMFFLGMSVLAINLSAAQFEGSGCAIADRLILTAYHVVEGAEEISLAFGERRISAVVTNYDAKADWALLSTFEDVPWHVPLSKSSAINLGEKVYTLGFPTSGILGDEIKYAEGTISALSGMFNDKGQIQISVPIQPGNSGGPLFDKNGILIGVVLATVDPVKFLELTGGALPQNLNFAVRVSVIPLPSKEEPKTKDSVNVEDNQKACCHIFVKARDNLKDKETTSVTGSLTEPKPRVRPKDILGTDKTRDENGNLESFCGFRFGDKIVEGLDLRSYSAYSSRYNVDKRIGSCFVKTVKLDKPFRGHDSAIIYVGRNTHKIMKVAIYGEIKSDESEQILSRRAKSIEENVQEILMRKYGVKLSYVSGMGMVGFVGKNTRFSQFCYGANNWGKGCISLWLDVTRLDIVDEECETTKCKDIETIKGGGEEVL